MHNKNISRPENILAVHYIYSVLFSYAKTKTWWLNEIFWHPMLLIDE